MGTNDDGKPALNFKREWFNGRVLIDEIDVTFLDQPKFRDLIMPHRHVISGVTASATATDKTSMFEKELLKISGFEIIQMNQNFKPTPIKTTHDE